MNAHADLLDWTQVASDLAAAGPVTYRLDSDSQLRLGIDPQAGRMMLDVLLDPNDPTPKLARYHFISVLRHADGGCHFVRLETGQKDLFTEFFNFSKAVADNVVNGGVTAYDALLETIGSFGRLFRSEGSITEEVRVGLIGELWVLTQLINEIGMEAVDCWMGPQKDAHDFRFGGAELEVKTTRSGDREHEISRIDQLQESAGKKLFLLSIQIIETPHDKSLTLGNLIAKIRGSLDSGSVLQSFDDKLADVLARELEAGVDETRPLYQLRSDPALIEVDDNFPRLVPKSLEKLSLHQKNGRITGLKYTIDVTGMGSPVGPGGIHAKLK